jgi:hypothetical protein
VRVHSGDPALAPVPNAPAYPAPPPCAPQLPGGYYCTGTVLLTGYAGITNPSASISALITKQLNAGITSVVLRVAPPPGQGSSVPIVIEHINSAGGADFSSANAAVLVYEFPEFTTFYVALPGSGEPSQTGLPAGASAATALLATIGGSTLTLRGTNLGIYPTVAVALATGLVPGAGLADCSGGAGTCWSVTTPPGEGTGLSYPAAFGAGGGAAAPSLNGLSGYYNCAAWGTWPGGYFAWLFAGDGVAQPLLARYAPPNGTALASLVGGALPASGLVPVRLLGVNLSAQSQPPTALAVQFSPVSGAGAGEWVPCASPAYSPGLAGTAEGSDCTLPPGVPGGNHLMLTVDNQVTVTPGAFFYYDTPPALTLVYAPASNATYDFSAASAQPRAHSQRRLRAVAVRH